MWKPTKQAVVDIYHDGTQFAEQVISDVRRLRIAHKIRPIKLSKWSASSQLPHPSIVITSNLTRTLLNPAAQPEQLLIVAHKLSFRELQQWPGEVTVWPEHPAYLSRQVRRVIEAFNTTQQLSAVRESLLWHNRRNEREFELVEHIFRNALSRNFLQYPFIRTLISSAAQFNGDLCLVAPGPQGNLFVMMADFTGHGLAPATGALPLSQAFFAMADRGVAITEMVTEFNSRLYRLLPNDMFCACFLLELSASGERLTYWNGGMPPALVYDQEGTIRHRLKAQHIALGVLTPDDFDAQAQSIRTQQSDHIAIYTDGVIELLSQQGKFLGAETFEGYLADYPGLADFDQLIAKLDTYRGDEPLHDDLSLAILQCKPTELATPTDDGETYALPFSFQSTLTSQDMQSLDVVSGVLSVLGRLPKLRSHRTTIYLLLAEVYNNALEHGLLGLDSRMKDDPDGFSYYYQLRAERLAQLTEGEVSISVNYHPQSHYLHFALTHNGEQWQWPEPDEKGPILRTYGRGVELLQHLASNVEWYDGGRRIEFGYYLNL
jgi:serine phosphatase RsbU (regulator of sigma subunit)